LVRSLARAGKVTEALEYCNVSDLLYSRIGMLLLCQGEVHLSIGLSDMAISEFSNALAKPGGHREAEVKLGLAYLQKGDPRHLEQARTLLEDLVRQAPNEGRYHYLLSQVDKAQGDTANAQAEAVQAERLNPGI